MKSIFKLRKLIFLLISLVPVILRSKGIIGNWATVGLAAIPVALLFILFNLEIEPDVSLDLSDGEGKAGVVTKTGVGGEFVIYTIIGSLLLLLTPIPLSISIFISAFISVLMLMNL